MMFLHVVEFLTNQMRHSGNLSCERMTKPRDDEVWCRVRAQSAEQVAEPGAGEGERDDQPPSVSASNRDREGKVLITETASGVVENPAVPPRPQIS